MKERNPATDDGDHAETVDADWMAPFIAPAMAPGKAPGKARALAQGERTVINVGVMTPQQRAETMARGVPTGITNMEKFVEQGVQTSQTQAKRASKPRTDTELAAIVCGLANRDESAKELWSALWGALDAAGCDPEEHTEDGDPRKWKIMYTDAGAHKRTVSLDTFQRMLGKNRKPK